MYCKILRFFQQDHQNILRSAATFLSFEPFLLSRWFSGGFPGLVAQKMILLVVFVWPVQQWVWGCVWGVCGECVGTRGTGRRTVHVLTLPEVETWL